MSRSINRWWVAVRGLAAASAITVIGATSVVTVGCGGKEETKSKSSRSSSDDDDSSTSRASGSSTYGDRPMGSSARRPPRMRDSDAEDGPPRRRGDPDEDPRHRSKSKGLLASLTDFVSDIVPKNPFSSSGGGSDIERAADEVCECKDKACMDSVMKRFDKRDSRKMEELSPDEQKAVQRLIECSLKLSDMDTKPAPRAVPVPTASPDSGW